MSFNYYTVKGIGVTASSIAPFVNPEKVIECIKKLHPSDLEQIENDTKDINDIGDLEKSQTDIFVSAGITAVSVKCLPV